MAEHCAEFDDLVRRTDHERHILHQETAKGCEDTCWCGSAVLRVRTAGNEADGLAGRAGSRACSLAVSHAAGQPRS